MKSRKSVSTSLLCRVELTRCAPKRTVLSVTSLTPADNPISSRLCKLKSRGCAKKNPVLRWSNNRRKRAFEGNSWKIDRHSYKDFREPK
jgi:hypothetical protein